MSKEIYPNELYELLNELNNKEHYIEDYGYQYKRISLDDTQMLMSYIKHLENKNEEIRNYYFDIVKVADRRLDLYIKYYSRCIKAIEYIENAGLSYYEKELYDILQGSDSK